MKATFPIPMRAALIAGVALAVAATAPAPARADSGEDRNIFDIVPDRFLPEHLRDEPSIRIRPGARIWPEEYRVLADRAYRDHYGETLRRAERYVLTERGDRLVIDVRRDLIVKVLEIAPRGRHGSRSQRGRHGDGRDWWNAF